MSNTATFSEHINKICEKARDMCSWILRTFRPRSPQLMITLWKSLVQPILDYCSQLWCPTTPGQIKQIEEIQKNFTRKIKTDHNLDYWGRLKTHRIYSQERRRERYRILYLWKMLEQLVPAIRGGHGGVSKLHPRNGRTFDIPFGNKNIPRHIKKSVTEAFSFTGQNFLMFSQKISGTAALAACQSLRVSWMASFPKSQMNLLSMGIIKVIQLALTAC